MKFQDNKDRNISNFAVRGRFQETSQCELNSIAKDKSRTVGKISYRKTAHPAFERPMGFANCDMAIFALVC